MFTCGLAADILFYSFAEWIMYASDPHIRELGSVQEWAGSVSSFSLGLFLGLYLVLAVAFGFMLHVRKRKSSEVFGSVPTNSWRTYRRMGRENHRFACSICPLAGAATIFSVATPLMAAAIEALFGDYSK